MTTREATHTISPPAWPPDGARGERRWPVIAIDLPVLYEDEGLDEMGDNTLHTEIDRIIYAGLLAHLADRPDHHLFANLNLHYHRLDREAYVSPDEMVVVADFPPGPDIGSYRVGETGPPPVLVVEVLSERTYQQQDLSPTGKPVVYGDTGVPEYILVDVRGEFLPERLLLKRLVAGGRDARGRPVWRDEQDPDGGVTSRLGFRLLIEEDGLIRVVDAASGRRYLRPAEAEAARRQAERQATAEAAARRQAEARAEELAARVAALEAELQQRSRPAHD
ncbi:MAG: Uma2 family endonuclease [Chloroflexi bacterium]|nr:Uma2 family endonuclease [Chloroflexota bacterium]